MKRMNRFAVVPALAVIVLGLASRADAQFGRYDSRVGYDNGYKEGLKEGEKDGRSRDAYEFRDERAWRDGDKGYHRNYGDRDRYRQVFRNGFESGYSVGYRQYAPSNNGRWGNGRGVPRGYPPYPNRAPGGYGYPGNEYPGGYRYPGNDRYGYGSSPAYSAGMRDGYEKGREDARDRDAYDPLRHNWYRSGDRDYRREYGSRDQYRDLYRQAFREGYDRGYRENTFRRW